jgi:hypothetical protein
VGNCGFNTSNSSSSIPSFLLNDKLKHDPIIDPDNVEESVLVKNAIKQAKKYQEQLKKLSKKEGIEDDELEVLKPQLPT